MRNYIKKNILLENFNKEKDNSWTKTTKAKFEKNLNNNFDTSIEKLTEFSYKLALIQLAYFMDGKPITSVEEAQIIGCSQATVAKLHTQLTKAALIEILKNPKSKKTSRKMKYIIRILWSRLDQLKPLHLINLNKLIKIISIKAMKDKASHIKSDSKGELTPL